MITNRYVISGFTLIELMISVSVLVILSIGGSLVLFSTLGSKSYNAADSIITNSSTQTLIAFEKIIKYAKIDSVVATATGTTYSRTGCNGAGSGGVSGDKLNAHDNYGSSIFLLSGNGIASNAAQMSSTDLVISNLAFTWYCVPGRNDRIKVFFKGTYVNSPGGFWLRDFSRDINLYNSRI